MMDVVIIKATNYYIQDCVNALLDSDLGTLEFKTSKVNPTLLFEEGIRKGELYVALNANDEFAGFAWIKEDGAFYYYCYLHLVVVKAKYRGMGIGTQLISFAEQIAFSQNKKIFLLVGEFNVLAKKLYESRGYIVISTIPSLFLEGISEHLMMKKII